MENFPFSFKLQIAHVGEKKVCRLTCFADKLETRNLNNIKIDWPTNDGNCDKFHESKGKNKHRERHCSSSEYPRRHLLSNFPWRVDKLSANKPPRKIYNDSPKYHSNVNFQPSKSDKSIDFDVQSHTQHAWLGSSGEENYLSRIFCLV